MNYRREVVNSVPCYHCNVQIGEECKTAKGEITLYPHIIRTHQYREYVIHKLRKEEEALHTMPPKKRASNDGRAARSRNRAIQRLIELHSEEFDRIHDEERLRVGLPRMADRPVRLNTVDRIMKDMSKLEPGDIEKLIEAMLKNLPK